MKSAILLVVFSIFHLILFLSGGDVGVFWVMFFLTCALTFNLELHTA
jgi:hypothetical protein